MLQQKFHYFFLFGLLFILQFTQTENNYITTITNISHPRILLLKGEIKYAQRAEKEFLNESFVGIDDKT